MHCLPDGYRIQDPVTYVEVGDDRHYQPDVYPFAAKLARNEGAVRLVDFGCSTGGKLIDLADEFDVIGLDLPGNLPGSDAGLWIGHDFDSRAKLPLGKTELDASVLICSDVIEHMVHPDRLVVKLKGALRWAACLVLSTPDRDRTRGPDDMGPPANLAHAREWTADELVRFLTAEGLTVEEQFWQRSYVGGPEATTVVVCR